MQIIGHKTRSVLDRYDVVNEVNLRSGLQRLAGTFSGTAGVGQWRGGQEVVQLFLPSILFTGLVLHLRGWPLDSHPPHRRIHAH